MPILASTTYVNAYGKSGVIALQAENLDSVAGSLDAFVVKYNSLGKALWSARIGSITADVGFGIVTDNAGNVYVTGLFSSVSTIYNSDGTVFDLLRISVGNNDAFIVKYDSDGIGQWGATLGSTGADNSLGIAIDPSGNLYITGQYSGVLTAYNSNKTAFGTTLANSGGTDVFIVKYNSSGFVQWVARLASSAADVGYGIATDSSGNVYITGQGGPGGVSPTVFNANGTSFGSITNSGQALCFIVKYNTNGTAQWSARVDSTAYELGYAIATDSSGNVYVTGQGGSGATITAFNANGTAFSPTYTASGEDAFVVKYNTNGAVQWFTRLSSGTTDLGFGIATDSSGNVYVTGNFGLTLSAFNANGTSFGTTLTNTGNRDIFVCKYDTDGTVQWLARVSSPTNEQPTGISTDSSGNVYVVIQSGSSGGVITVQNANGTVFGTIPTTESTDTFFIKYNTSGTVQWATRIASASQSDYAQGVSTDTLGNVYITGQFTGEKTSIYGQAISIFTTIPNAGSSDAFIVKYTTTGNPQWVTRIASTGDDTAYGVSTDSSGNVYVTGQGGSGIVVTAFSSDGSAFSPTIANSGSNDTFIVKYNASGIVQWVARVASSAADIGYAIKTDSSGNVYVAGTGGPGAVVTAFNSNGSAFGTTLPNGGNGNTDGFIVKYNASGTVQWVARVAGGGGENIFAIATDSSGNVYVTGGQTVASSTVTAFSSNGVAFGTTLPNRGSGDAFIVKYDTNGIVQWVAQVASSVSDIAYGITSDSSGNVYVTGSPGADTVTVYNANGTAFGTTLPNSGFGDAFLVKYNTSGSVQWVTRIASAQLDIGYAVASDSNGSVYVVGQTGGNAVVTPFSSNGEAFWRTITAAGTDGFIVKYNSSGIVEWITQISTNGSDIAYAVDSDSLGNIYVTGTPDSATAVATIFNSDGNTFGVTTGSSFIVKYNTQGFAQWVQGIRSSTNFTQNRGIAVDTTGNSHVVGSYSGGPLQIYNIDNTVYKSINTVTSGVSGFVVKYSNNTTPLWVAIITSTAFTTVFGFSVGSDSSGNVYAVGQVSSGTGTILTFYNSTGTIFGTLTPQNGDAFVVKYNSDGLVQWVTRIASTASDIGYGVSVDSGGNVHVIGQGGFGVTITAFNSNGTAFSQTLGNSGENDAFIVKYNTSGSVQWVARVASTGSDVGYAIATDSTSNVYVTGYGGAVTTARNSDQTAFGTTIPNAGNGDVFIVKYNASGTVQWVTRVGSTAADEGFGIATDTGGNVYVTGYYGAATLTVYSSNGGIFGTLANSGGNDIFVVKYDTNGIALWAARIASTGNDFGQAIATDSSGNVYIAGRYGATLTVFNANGTSFSPTLAFSGTFCGFVAKYNTNGTVQWAARITSAGGSVIVNAIATDSSGSVYVTGQGPDGEVFTVHNADGNVFGSVTLPVNSRGFSCFLVKYNTSGVVQWVSLINGTSTEVGNGIALDSSSNIYLTGRFTGSSFIASSV